MKRWRRKKREALFPSRGFTLVELIIVITIVALLSAVGYIGYRVTIDKANTKVCEHNQKVIYEALKIYALENYNLPGSLGEIPAEYYQRAYVKLLNQEKNPLWVKLAYLLVDLKKKGMIKKVFGNSLLDKGLIEKRVLDCPLDPTPYSQGGISYGLNQALVNATLEEFEEFGGVVIGDSDNATFSEFSGEELAYRHRKNILREAAVVILKGGKISTITPLTPTEVETVDSCIAGCKDTYHPSYPNCKKYCQAQYPGDKDMQKQCKKDCKENVKNCKKNCIENVAAHGGGHGGGHGEGHGGGHGEGHGGGHGS